MSSLRHWRKEFRTVEQQRANEQNGVGRTDPSMTLAPADLSGMSIAGALVLGMPGMDVSAPMSGGNRAGVSAVSGSQYEVLTSGSSSMGGGPGQGWDQQG